MIPLELMKVLNLIIASIDEPYYVSLMKEWRRYMNAHPDVMSYFIRFDKEACGEEDYVTDELTNTLFLRGDDGYIPEIYDKTSLAIKILLSLPAYAEVNYVVRTNLSSFWIWDNLVTSLREMSSNRFISAVIGDVNHGQPSGCGMVMSRDVAQLWANNFDYPMKRRTFDDVAFGRLLAEEQVPIVPAGRFDIEAHHSFPAVIETIRLSKVYHVRNKIHWDQGLRKSGREAENYAMLIDTFYGKKDPI